MSHPDFKHIGEIEDRFIEEMAELTKAICKARRFGYAGNFDNIISEFEDVTTLATEYAKYLKAKLP